MSVGQAIPSGPHENPYDEDYAWWKHHGRTFFRGHEFTLTCQPCGEELAFDALYGEGMQFNFVCESETCTIEKEQVVGERTFESKRSVGVCPANCRPGEWQVFVEGGHEASIEHDGDSWLIRGNDGEAVAELESETLAKAVSA